MYLELEKLNKSFDGKSAVCDLSLGVERGELLCILGSSGCGKTTTLNMIGGFLAPDSGTILLDGQDVTNMPPERRPVSTVFQSYGLFPHMTVLENVMYPMTLRGISAHKAKETAKEKLAAVGLDETYYKRLPDMLSGGEQQRVAIARALASDAKVLLADEPTGNLDTENGKNIIDILKTLAREQGYCVIVVTHDLGIAAEADEVLHLSDGMVKAE